MSPKENDFLEERLHLRSVRRTKRNVRTRISELSSDLSALRRLLGDLEEKEIELQKLWTPVTLVPSKVKGKAPEIEISEEEFLKRLKKLRGGKL